MKSLEKTLRNELARTVLAARKLAEEAAGKALHALGVNESDAPGHLDNNGRRLRIRLRAQARQLGDRDDRQKQGCYEIRHLIEKIAYDHWHRLLFARFLAENDLLISPDHGVGISLDYCGDLAPEMGLRDGWEVAASFAARMLPQIFRADDPVGNVVFAPEDRVSLRKLVTNLPRDVFLADDSLGWVYQFWQAQRKDEVNKSGDKIGADEIAPVTQLFTEDYMVLFLLHNTLGAWWAARQLDQTFFRNPLANEEEVREVIALPGVNWEYLRFIRDDGTDHSPPPNSAHWRPASGNFDGWPKTAKELRLLDPSMGSGHFVAAELPILVAMRMAEEGLSIADAVATVVRDNLFGLEIDPRCTQIAAFNVALAAWKLIGEFRQLPPFNLACCGLGINARQEEWLKLAGDNTRLRGGIGQLFDLFQKAPILVSLINPRHVTGDLLMAEFHELQPLLEQALSREETKRDETLAEMGVTARGLVHAAEILAGKFTLVATNVPYLGTKKQDDMLKGYCERIHPDAKSDLATCFIERSLDFCAEGCSTTLVTPHNWLFLGAYKALRQRLLADVQLNAVARLGPRAFETISGEVVNVALLALTCGRPSKGHSFMGLDVSEQYDASAKAKALCEELPIPFDQPGQSKNPDARITLENPSAIALLSVVATDHQGLSTGDNPRFRRSCWEVPMLGDLWEAEQSSVENHNLYAGRSGIVMWSTLAKFSTFCRPHRGNEAWGRFGVAIAQMGKLPATLFNGQKFDTNTAVLVPTNSSMLPALWSFCSSSEFHLAVRVIDQAIKVTNTTFGKVPFDLARWEKVAVEKYPHGLPKPFSSDPTQWLFNGLPAGSDQPLQVAVARLLGYRWPRQTGSSFPDCPALDLDGLGKCADADGIVCLNAIKGEQSAAERLRALLAASFGRDWSATKQAELLAQAEYAGKTLEDWLRNGFFEQHCQLFLQRPFIWQIWDGLRDGFSALVNYHKLDRRTLEKLIYTYLGDWIARQKAAVAASEEGSDAKLAAAQGLKAALEQILEGESPCDIFVRWKPLEKQPIGWDPDLNDGVRLNIRPFLSVPDVGKKGAGILRWKPNIKWGKDRGTDGASGPWFKVFKGDRINDHHLMLSEKRKVREG